MATFTFELYRVKFLRPDQLTLAGVIKSPRELYLSALRETQALQTGHTTKWHIGGITPLKKPKGMAYFQIGRTSQAVHAMFDEDARRFIMTETEDSPFTHAILDHSIGVIAIAAKSNLSKRTSALAKKVREMLAYTDTVDRYRLQVLVDPIPDPSGLVKILKSAHEIVSFRASFTGPNPTDADAWFSKPLSKIAAKTNGREGAILIKGGKLNSDNVVDAVKNVAAVGNDASARIKRTSRSKPIVERLNKYSATVNVADDETPAGMANAVREKYRDIKPDD